MNTAIGIVITGITSWPAGSMTSASPASLSATPQTPPSTTPSAPFHQASSSSCSPAVIALLSRKLRSSPVNAIGVAVPGIVRQGVIEDSPNSPR